VTQRDVPGDGVAEAGPSSAAVARLFDDFADVELVRVHDLAGFDLARLPSDGRATVLASNMRARYGVQPAAPDLHLVLWNPFQALDLAVPTVVTYGYADGALDALRAWLEGRATAPGHPPVPLD